jgi:hypothetical protein
MLDRLHSRSGPEVPPDLVVPPPVIDEPTQKLHIITMPSPRVEARAVLVYDQTPRKPWRLWAFTAVLVALTIGVVLGQAEAFEAPSRGSTAQAATVPPPPSTAPAAAPVNGVKALTFEVAGDVTVLHVATADLGDQLYTVTPLDPSIEPRITDTAAGPRLDLARTAVTGTAGAEVRLNAKVAWTLRVASAASDQDIDLRAGGLAALELAGNTARATVRLPSAKTTVRVAVTGGVSRLTVGTESPARLRLKAGADIAVVDGRTTRTAKPGTTLTAKGWTKSRGRYDVTVTKAVSHIDVGFPTGQS